MIYASLKKFTKSVLPERLLYRVDPVLRRIFSIAYKGNQVFCPVCKHSFKQFILLENGNDTLCPACGSLPRNRLLWLYLNNEEKIRRTTLKVLHFSPSRSLERKLRKLKNLEYITTHYESNHGDKRYDITHIGEDNNIYDVIICYHVLEHIPDDKTAMEELYRILKRDGIALIQTPLKEGNTYENTTITSPEDRLQHFGQEDHVRIYGKEDLKLRLQRARFGVSICEYAKGFSKEEIKRMGLNENETIFECIK